jgi:hypothetical protein
MSLDTDYLKCTDCAHARCGGTVNTFLARVINIQWGWTCQLYRESGSFNAATGHQLPDTQMSCNIARGKYGECGPDARKWTPHRKQDLFRLLARKESTNV